jgi:putative peptidoglycan lipid II flippase
MAVAFGAAYLVGALAAWWILRGRMGGVDGRRILRTYGLLTAAALPGCAVAYAVHHLAAAGWGDGMFPALVSLTAGSAAFGVLYLLLARVLRIAELESLRAQVLGRFRR